jgi:serine/threonine protein phosphatase PrpC/formylglycine-generating enzyme required for sulfatase activity
MHEPPWIATWDQHQGGRSYQEDCAVVFRKPEEHCWLAIVADGVGGHGGGDRASRVILEVAQVHWDRGGVAREDPRRFLERLCQDANRRIAALEQELGVRARSTIVALLVQGNRAVVAHSGDSRLYHFRDGILRSRTRDHSVLQILLEQGKVREEDMGNHPDQGRLLQSLGDPEMKDPEFTEMSVDGRDAFLLCTDGFWEKVTRAEMERFIRSRDDLEGHLRVLVGLAAKRGGKQGDNVSAAVLVGTAPWTPERGLPETLQILNRDVRPTAAGPAAAPGPGSAPWPFPPVPSPSGPPGGFRSAQRWATGPILAVLLAALALVLVLLAQLFRSQGPATEEAVPAPVARKAEPDPPKARPVVEGDREKRVRERYDELKRLEVFLNPDVEEAIKVDYSRHYPFQPESPTLLLEKKHRLASIRKVIEEALSSGRWDAAEERLGEWERLAKELRVDLERWKRYLEPPEKPPFVLPLDRTPRAGDPPPRTMFPLPVVWVPPPAEGKPYWIARTEFTYAQYETFKELAKRHNAFAPDKPRIDEDPLDLDGRTARRDFPVTDVAWTHVDAFAKALTALARSGGEDGIFLNPLFQNWVFALPTTTEWNEVAKIHAYPQLQHFERLSAGEREHAVRLLKQISVSRDDSPRPTEVGRRAPCPLGTSDLFGNVWEWCSDNERPKHWFGEMRDWFGGGAELRAIAGGSFKIKPEKLPEWSQRHKSDHADDIGFRLVIRRTD